MTSTFSITSALLLSGSLLLAGCASTGQGQEVNVQNNKNYTFPSEIYDGYWAMTSPASDNAIVVSFDQGVYYHYTFACGTNGRYQQIHYETGDLVPSPTGMGLQSEGEPIYSETKVLSLQPKRSLQLTQRFFKPALKQSMPNGMNYTYVYSPTLKPICR